jgi:thiosulfate reductase cytochrome b subunit
MSAIVYGVLSLLLCYVLACRIDKMVKGVTKPIVFWQHALLGVAVLAAWLVQFTRFHEWADCILAAGLLSFFLLSLDRWKTSPPKGTELQEVPREMLQHVSGGKR